MTAKYVILIAAIVPVANADAFGNIQGNPEQAGASAEVYWVFRRSMAEETTKSCPYAGPDVLSPAGVVVGPGRNELEARGYTGGLYYRDYSTHDPAPYTKVLSCEGKRGWTALVTLWDSDKGRSCPRYGMGLVCGQPTEAIALNQAHAQAIKSFREQTTSVPTRQRSLAGFSAFPSFEGNRLEAPQGVALAHASECQGLLTSVGTGGTKDFHSYLKSLPVWYPAEGASIPPSACYGWNMNSKGLPPPSVEAAEKRADELRARVAEAAARERERAQEREAAARVAAEARERELRAEQFSREERERTERVARERRVMAERERQAREEAEARRKAEADNVDFEVVDEESVRHKKTGLIWARAGRVSYFDMAEYYCKQRGVGWRLPTVKELKSLITPRINGQKCGSSTCLVAPAIELSERILWTSDTTWNINLVRKHDAIWMDDGTTVYSYEKREKEHASICVKP